MPTPYAYLRGEFVPLADAKIGVMTHAFNYGTAVFEGIRGNWNAENETTYLFRVAEHYERLAKSCRILKLDLPYTTDELMDLSVRLVEMCGYQEDIYLRPLVYKSSEALGVRLHNLESDLILFVAPFGPYLDVEAGARCMTSSWRRVDDTSIPARAKVTGIYVNSALAKTEANEYGFDEAIMLNADGHVSEGSGENIFMIMNGKLMTPPASDNILVGITRDTVITFAKEELGIDTVERQIDRSELYIADEVFMTGTAAHVTPIIEVDKRAVGTGEVGPISKQIMRGYFETLVGKNSRYAHWCTPVQSKVNA
jgi:branched-chain amino acid aminotransferase